MKVETKGDHTGYIIEISNKDAKILYELLKTDLIGGLLALEQCDVAHELKTKLEEKQSSQEIHHDT